MKTTMNYLLCHFYAFQLFIAFGHGKDLFFNDHGQLQLPESYTIDWMRGIVDEKLLCDITIPGTHDTMALYGGPAAECQAWPLADQLRAGIRVLDLRVFELEDKLYVMHWVVYEHTSFNTVLDTIRAFLSEFPSETVLVKVQPDLIHKDKVEGLVKGMFSNDKDVWMRSDVPTMGMARGKIVFLQDASFKLGLAIDETDRKHDYEVTNIADKEKLIAKHLTQANRMCGGTSIVFNHSSGTGIGTVMGMFLTPKRVAEKVDPWLAGWLKTFYNSYPWPCLGIIAMDFPGIDLIQTVIQYNF